MRVLSQFTHSPHANMNKEMAVGAAANKKITWKILFAIFRITSSRFFYLFFLFFATLYRCCRQSFASQLWYRCVNRCGAFINYLLRFCLEANLSIFLFIRFLRAHSTSIGGSINCVWGTIFILSNTIATLDRHKYETHFRTVWLFFFGIFFC